MATIDNYLRCVEYEGHGPANHPGFTQFFKEDTNMWYFAMVAPSGRVLLKSEGYASEAGRNNGIESVIRNRDIAERFVVIQDEGGHWRAVLRAGNRQEIAVSCAYDTEAGAQGHIAMCDSGWVEPVAVAEKAVAAVPKVIDDYLPCDDYAGMPDLQEESFSGFYSESRNEWYFSMNDFTGKTLLRSEGYTNEAGRANGVQSVIKNRDLRERYKVWQRPDNTWVVSLNAGNHQEIARSCPFPTEAEAKAHIEACLDWAFVPAVEKAVKAAPRVSEANHDEYMPCEAYAGKEVSEKYPGFSSFREEDGMYYFAMVNADGKVLLKSESYPSAAPRDNGIESVIRNRDIRERWSEKQDEGGYYLSLRAGNNMEIGRTCHYTESGAWWNWIFPVAAPVVVEKIVEAPPAPIVVEKPIEVKAEPIIVEKKIEIPPVVIPPVVIPPVVVEKKVEIPPVVIPPVVIPPKKEEIEVKPIIVEKKVVVPPVVVPPVVVEKKAAAPEPPKVVVTPPKATVYTKPVEVEKKVDPVVVPPVAAQSDGCMKYWWLLPLLLALAALWYFTKDGCSKKAEVPPVKVEVPTAPVPTPVEPPKPAAPTCSCTGNSDALFNIPVGSVAKKLTRLGTNPEFGNSHDMSAAEFYAKLAKNAKNNAADSKFLDRVFKGMGYADGWKSATADMFTEVVLPVGTSGNLGYSKAHKTGYYTLPDAERDRMAFRIKSANGCDMHFMKTCGNHFFTCGN